MKSRSTLVVAVDYSAPSAAALHEAGRLAAATDSRLAVVHVVYDEEISFATHRTGLSREEILTGRRLRLDRFCLDTLGTRMVPQLQLEIIVGHPFTELVRVVEREDAGLLVLGARGESHAQPGTLGTLAARCARHAPCGILLVRSSLTEGFQSIVTAIDFTESPRLALRRAVEIARVDGSELHLLHVYAPAWKDSALHRGDLHVEATEEQAYLARIERRLTDFVVEELADLEGHAARIEIRESFSRAAGIVGYLHEVDADLVVLGGKAHDEADLGNLGTTAEYLVHDAPCSVLRLLPEADVFHPGPD